MTSYDAGCNYAPLSPSSSIGGGGGECHGQNQSHGAAGGGSAADASALAHSDDVVVVGSVRRDSEARAAAGALSDSSAQTSPMLSTQELLSLFECPVCYEYILPPAFQCCQGHPICHSCKRKVSHCPSCREELGNIRCLLMEKVGDTLQFPCKYAMQGCGLMLHRSRKATHELEQCEFKLFECPYRFIDNCLEWYGKAEKVVEHLTLVHLENFKREHGNLRPWMGDSFPLVPYVHVIDYSADNNSTSWMWTALQSCHGSTFVVNLYYVHNLLTNVHFVTVRVIDTVEAAKNFRYLVRLDGPNGDLSYRGRCHSLHEDVKEIYENRDCLQFDNVTAAKFKSELTVDGARQPVLKLLIKIAKISPSSSSAQQAPGNADSDVLMEDDFEGVL